jgi:hypothetical protein
MQGAQLFPPLLAMFGLTVALSTYMLFVRVRDALSGKLDPRYFLTFSAGQPTLSVLKTQRHYANLFEIPVLFYLVVVLAMIFKFEDSGFHTLSWLFVFARLAHLLIHVGPNRLYPRMFAFFGGYTILVIMWIKLAAFILQTN